MARISLQKAGQAYSAAAFVQSESLAARNSNVGDLRQTWPVIDRTAATSPEASGYALRHEGNGTSYTVRENLVDILERELLGPIHGPEEVLPFSPRSAVSCGVHRSGQAHEHLCTELSHDDEIDMTEVRLADDGAMAGRGVSRLRPTRPRPTPRTTMPRIGLLSRA